MSADLMTSLPERFRSKFTVDKSGCWRWDAFKDHLGYGHYWLIVNGRGRMHKAHRVAYELAVGTIPDGLVIDHLCRNRACVNPAHLEPVTQHENVSRGSIPRMAAQRRAANGIPEPLRLLDAGDPRHGTSTGYARGCRCEVCRFAAAAARRQSRANARAIARVLDIDGGDAS